MTKKRIFLVLTACILIMMTSFSITYAYLVANDSKVNEFTIGRNTIEIEEIYEPPEKLKPDTVITKMPRVKNTGNLPCFVRMRADFSDSRAKDFCKPLIISDDWYYEDGYYYYKFLLAPEKYTSYLFEKVEIRSDCEMSDMIDFDILIYAESCQHNDHTGACAENEYLNSWK